MKYVIGSDPELFVFDSESGSFVSAHNLIPGTKLDPYIVTNGAVQVDGVAAEFNTIPAETANDFANYMSDVISQLETMIKSNSQDYELCPTPTAHFEPDYFKALPDEARRLGCAPDFNAYTGKMNCPPNPDVYFRTGAGHIHVGIDEPLWDTSPFSTDFLEICERVKQLDTTIYPMSLQWDQDRERQKLYGSKGAFRPKFYGFEYRSLSNSYVMDSSIIKWIFDTTIHSMDLYDQDVKLWEENFDMTSVADREAYGFRSWQSLSDIPMNFHSELAHV